MAWTTPRDWVTGEVVTEPMMDTHVRDNMIHLKALADSGVGNLLTNPGFEVRQRGDGPFTAANAYTADRWQILLVGTSTVSVTRIASTIGSKGSSLQMVYTHVAAGQGHIAQRYEDFTQHIGKQVTFAIKVKSTVAGTVRLNANDGPTTTLSAYNVGTGEEVLTVTHSVNAAATYLRVGIQCDVASCTVEINDAMLVPGAIPADYVPLTPAEDLFRCQRYYERAGDSAHISRTISGYGAAAATQDRWFPWRTPKAINPTVTKVGSWTVTNCSQPTIADSDSQGFDLQTTITALGTIFTGMQSVGEYVEAVANP